LTSSSPTPSVFAWGDYQALARTLAVQADEASLRSAVSRAYYASFGSARTVATTRGFVSTRTGADHSALWRWFAAETSKEGRRIANLGFRLRLKRTKADYRDVVSGLPSMAAVAVSETDQILATLSTI
jgi:uncharacterized protein (UPF0332 family)